MSDCKFADAFYLMAYESKDGCIREYIWNSRDGVTPFMVRSKDGSCFLEHVDWHLDMYRPNHKPQSGDRIFVDATVENLEPKVRKYIEKHWDHWNCLNKRFNSKEEAFAILMKEWLVPGSPDIVIVD